MSAPKVLVVYGTRNGGTAGIANVIGQALTEAGVEATVRAASRVDDVSGYDGVVLGGALYGGHWHRDARAFAHRFAKRLVGRPIWVFSSGPLDTSADEQEIPPVRQAASVVRELQARGHVTFGGRLDEYADGFLARAMVRNGRGGDFRNDERIRSWSQVIARELAAAGATR